MKIWVTTGFNGGNASDDELAFSPTKEKAMDAARLMAGGSLPSSDPDFSYSINPVEVDPGREGICKVLNGFLGVVL